VKRCRSWRPASTTDVHRTGDQDETRAPRLRLSRVTGTHDVHRSRWQTWGNGCRRPRWGTDPDGRPTEPISTADPGEEACTPPTPDPPPTPPTFHVKRLCGQDVGLCVMTLHSGCPSPRQVAGTDHAMSPRGRLPEECPGRHTSTRGLEHGTGETTRAVRSRSGTLPEQAEPGPSRSMNVPPPAVASEDRLTVSGERSRPTDDTGPDELFASVGRAFSSVDHGAKVVDGQAPRARPHDRTVVSD